jgi:hypothetical protein
MHAEAVKSGAIASKTGLIEDSNRVLTCPECDVRYHLHYDREAEPTFPFCSVLASEIITARHPDHGNNIVLQLPEMNERARPQVQVVDSDAPGQPPQQQVGHQLVERVITGVKARLPSLPSSRGRTCFPETVVPNPCRRCRMQSLARA